MTSRNTSIRIPTDLFEQLKVAAAIKVLRDYLASQPLEYSVNALIVSGLSTAVGSQPPLPKERVEKGDMTTLLATFPDELFDKVSEVAASKGITRNALYSDELATFIKNQYGSDIENVLNILKVKTSGDGNSGELSSASRKRPRPSF